MGSGAGPGLVLILLECNQFGQFLASCAPASPELGFPMVPLPCVGPAAQARLKVTLYLDQPIFRGSELV